jgi:hypothetical protein
MIKRLPQTITINLDRLMGLLQFHLILHLHKMIVIRELIIYKKFLTPELIIME